MWDYHLSSGSQTILHLQKQKLSGNVFAERGPLHSKVVSYIGALYGKKYKGQIKKNGPKI